MSQITTIQYAWAIYFAGSLGCTIAAWWMFIWAWRFVRYAAVVTVLTLLFTPYAIDAETMTMAPAIYTLVFEGMSQGLPAITPLIKLMVGIWLIGIILVLVFVVLTRKSGEQKSPRNKPRGTQSSSSRNSRRLEHHGGRRHETPVVRSSSRGLSRDEFEAREELLKGEVPMRAIRD
ncbi:hypothetical protein GCM10011613_06780 [Cellvibrio zantedeschiae]|uniref:MFS transporter n=1 Tax=Cellvibrio zantedeschiae TaxID=1237077 RepID=A0ABQ3AVL4_9GAMM|nr:hypothetical protein [Cellvibrio zantedeschiae]GGY65557.1 hypothetical protein GCM10011613_06780 [Cellvibrio zantedeschiae]